MNSGGYTEFFRRYYSFVYLFFTLSLVSSQTGMDASFLLLLIGLMVESYRCPENIPLDRTLLAVVLGFLALLLVPELINFSWRGLDELIVHHYRKVLLLVLIPATIRSERLLWWTTRLLILFAGLAAFFTVLAYVTRLPQLYLFVEGGFVYPKKYFMQGWIRGSGPGGWKSVQFGNVLAFLFPFVFFLWIHHLRESGWKRSAIYGAGVLSLFLGIVVSHSRMPLLAVSGFILLVIAVLLSGRVWSWYREPEQKRPALLSSSFLIVCVVAAILVVGVLTSSKMQWRMGQALTKASSSDRVEMWKSVYRQTLRRPGVMLLGSGTERGMDHFRTIKERPLAMLDEKNRQHAHNNLVQYFLDYGVFGPVAYLLLWLFYVWRLRWMSGESDWWIFRWGGLGLVLVFNLCGLTEFNWGRSPTHYNAAFLMGLTLAANVLSTRNQRGASDGQPSS